MTSPPTNLHAELEERLRFETLIANLSSRFINLPVSQVDQEIEDAQRQVCECLGLELSALWQWSVHNPEVVTMTHLYRPLGGPPVPEKMNAQDYFPWCMQEVKAGRTVKFCSLGEVPGEAARDLETWRHYAIKTVLIFPLMAGGGPSFGAVSFHTVRAERGWAENIVNRLVLVTQIFANAVARKRAEQVLRENEARLSLAADSADAGLWELDCGTGVFWATERARSIFGYPREHVITLESFEALVHTEDLELVRRVIRLAIEEREPINAEYRIRPADGPVKWIASRGRPYFNASGAPERLIGVSIDITESKQAEMESEELRRTLAHSGRVTLLGQLASALAHELSQPLSAILRNAEAAELMLEESTPDLKELRAIVKDIRADDQRAGHIIDRLRSLLKRRSLDPQPIELDGVVTEVLALIQADAAARQVKLAYTATPRLPRVRGDRIHLQQVLLNLLMNSMDAVAEIEPSERRVHVTCRQADSGMAEVRVCDSGSGIAAEARERVFEPFFTTKANGMGMGLPVSKSIIEAHRGRIWAEDRAEGGASFCFTVPVAGDERQRAEDKQEGK